MPEYIRGYVTPQIIRKAIGSPAVNFILADISETIMLDNSIGSPSNPIYFNFDNTATTGSSSGYLNGGDSIELDLRCGSISVLGSGTSTHIVQVIRMT